MNEEKIYFNIRKSQVVNDPELFKKLNELNQEFRTKFNRNYYRFLAFWDKTDKEETLVLATSGFIKKTKKTPKDEIKRAEEIRKEYFEQKAKISKIENNFTDARFGTILKVFRALNAKTNFNVEFMNQNISLE